MSYTHTIIKMTPVGKANSVTHVETDLDKDFVLENFVIPYINNQPFFVSGARIESGKVESVRIFETSVDFKQLQKDLQKKSDDHGDELARSGVIFMPIILSKEDILESEDSKEITRELFNKAQSI